MKTICVFCSAGDVQEKYSNIAKGLAQCMVDNGYDLVWGGSNVGFMKIIADEVQTRGGKIIGISVEMLKDKRRMNANEMIITRDLHERKQQFLKRGDAFILLPGGIGSLDEITEILEYKKHNLHNKPIVVINTDGFYTGLNDQLTRMYKEGFIRKPLSELLRFVDSPKEAIDLINDQLPRSLYGSA
jgi:uncharacterized protein (TIGR00730 family)